MLISYIAVQGSPEGCFIERICESRIQRVEMGMVAPTIYPSDSLAKFLLPVPKTLSYAELQLLFPEACTRKYNNDTIKLEAKAFPWLFWSSHAFVGIS